MTPSSAATQSVSKINELTGESNIAKSTAQNSITNRTRGFGELADSAIALAQVNADKRKVIDLLKDLFVKGTEVEKNVLTLMLKRYLITKSASL